MECKWKLSFQFALSFFTKQVACDNYTLMIKNLKPSMSIIYLVWWRHQNWGGGGCWDYMFIARLMSRRITFS